MAKKKQPVMMGAPEWVLTYGDMMGLLLCFFVVLFSLSEIKGKEEVKEALESLSAAFGGPGGIGRVDSNVPPRNTLETLQEHFRQMQDQMKEGSAPMEGMEGRYLEVRRINEGLEFIIGKGGRTPFARGSAQIEPESKKELTFIAAKMLGFNNVISVRGHCSLNDFPPNTGRKAFDTLSFARAEAIKDYLIDVCGIDARRVRTVACGNIQPLVPRAYDEDEHAANRRVEIIFQQVLVDDYAAVTTGE